MPLPASPVASTLASFSMVTLPVALSVTDEAARVAPSFTVTVVCGPSALLPITSSANPLPDTDAVSSTRVSFTSVCVDAAPLCTTTFLAPRVRTPPSPSRRAAPDRVPFIRALVALMVMSPPFLEENSLRSAKSPSLRTSAALRTLYPLRESVPMDVPVTVPYPATTRYPSRERACWPGTSCIPASCTTSAPGTKAYWSAGSREYTPASSPSSGTASR